jgi:hypothetical protein
VAVEGIGTSRERALHRFAGQSTQIGRGGHERSQTAERSSEKYMIVTSRPEILGADQKE